MENRSFAWSTLGSQSPSLCPTRGPSGRARGSLPAPWERWDRSEAPLLAPLPKDGPGRASLIGCTPEEGSCFSPQPAAALQSATEAFLLWQAQAYCSRMGHRRVVRLASLHMSNTQLLQQEGEQKVATGGR